MKKSVLLIDDDNDFLEATEMCLKNLFIVRTCSSVSQAKRLLIQHNFDVAVVDLNFEGQSEDGISLMDYFQKSKIDTPYIVLSSDSNTKRVFDASRRAYFDFIIKDGDHVENLTTSIGKAAQYKRALEEKRNASSTYLTSNSKMKTILLQIEKVLKSTSDSPIMILGESGTGKEVMAKHIAGFLNLPIVCVNMSAIPKELEESELFGHKKGSFTGAVADKVGLIEKANGGILFMDEIGDCPLSLQTKLLRVIQEREITPVGATKPTKVNVRFITATHKNLESMCNNGTFRFDFYQRLKTFVFEILPLRERPEDIEIYVHKFLEELFPSQNYSFSDLALQLMQTHSWLGNIRELKSTIENLCIFSETKTISDTEVQQVLGRDSERNQVKRHIDTYLTKDEIVGKLKEFNGNRRRTAKNLGVHISTFYRYLKRFDLEDAVEGKIGRPKELTQGLV